MVVVPVKIHNTHTNLYPILFPEFYPFFASTHSCSSPGQCSLNAQALYHTSVLTVTTYTQNVNATSEVGR